MTLRFRTAAILWALAAITAAAVSTAPVAASDGVLEIHQACVATGCFPGDTPGFPVEIKATGSYRLTSDLRLPDENATGIDILADGASIDLGGFGIFGVTDCGTSGPCSPVGTGLGIRGFSEGNRVTNGRVKGAGDTGITLGVAGVVEDVNLSHNGLDGIRLVDGGTVSRCISRRNGRHGLLVNGTCRLIGNLTELNEDDGIFVSGQCSVESNSSHSNRGYGLRLGESSVAIGNSLAHNDDSGLHGFSTSGYVHNSLRGNADGTPDGQVTGFSSQLGLNVCAGDLCP
jgi:hypothetical protein